MLTQTVLQTPLSFALIIQCKNDADEEIKFMKFCTYIVLKCAYVSCMDSTCLYVQTTHMAGLRSFQILWGRFKVGYSKCRGPGSSVGIATGFGLDGPRIESRWGRDFPHLSRPALGPTQPPVQWVPGLSRGKERPERDADHSPPFRAVVKKE